MRLHRPIGIWLLLWPTLWAVWIAAAGKPDQSIFLIFVIGTIVARSAGCVINDFADRRIDPHVARTADRPLATGEVAPAEALILFAALTVRAGRVRLNGSRVKPAHDVKVGDSLAIARRDDDGERDVEITAIPVRRGSATVAAQCYVETAESLERARLATEQRALRPSFAPPTEGRPDKRTRRLLLRAKDRR
jgi:ribosomal 50S subunit-recycling heat shock protein